jgi:sec-independent protein translocase protein TatA
MDIGAPELIIVLLIILLVFGGAKLPKLARSLGEAQREFKNGLVKPAVDRSEAVPEVSRAKPAAVPTDTP